MSLEDSYHAELALDAIRERNLLRKRAARTFTHRELKVLQVIFDDPAIESRLQTFESVFQSRKEWNDFRKKLGR